MFSVSRKKFVKITFKNSPNRLNERSCKLYVYLLYIYIFLQYCNVCKTRPKKEKEVKYTKSATLLISSSFLVEPWGKLCKLSANSKMRNGETNESSDRKLTTPIAMFRSVKPSKKIYAADFMGAVNIHCKCDFAPLAVHARGRLTKKEPT